jgi:hypothetical protein
VIPVSPEAGTIIAVFGVEDSSGLLSKADRDQLARQLAAS